MAIKGIQYIESLHGKVIDTTSHSGKVKVNVRDNAAFPELVVVAIGGEGDFSTAVVDLNASQLSDLITVLLVAYARLVDNA